jgi:hypothetical protein
LINSSFVFWSFSSSSSSYSAMYWSIRLFIWSTKRFLNFCFASSRSSLVCFVDQHSSFWQTKHTFFVRFWFLLFWYLRFWYSRFCSRFWYSRRFWSIRDWKFRW